MSQIISLRFSDNEMIELLMKLSDEEGVAMSVGKFCKQTILTSRVKFANPETEKYKAFLLKKIGNNINQIAHRLNIDNIANKVNEKTYLDNMKELEKLVDMVNELGAPVAN